MTEKHASVAGEVVLKPGKEKSLRRRHPWVYDTAVARVGGKPAPGATVAVRGADGSWLAWAAYSPQSTLRARCWSFVENDTIDRDWFAARVQAAVARRAHLAGASDALRLVFGEADQLPGLIADRYGRQLVVQFQAAGVEAQRDLLLDALVAASGCVNVYDRSDSTTRQREGLPATQGVARGAEPPELIRVREKVHEDALDFLVDVRRGHKTGFYIDQRDNRALAGALTRQLARELGRAPRVLNCFSYTGGFSLAALIGGAGVVLSIDSSADALELARSNCGNSGKNGGKDNGDSSVGARGAALEWQQADVFDALRELQRAEREFDLIVLDPPKFAASHHHVDRAARAYKDINMNALRLLAQGGALMTFSCSGAIDSDLFQKIVAGAVIDARVHVQMRRRLAAGEDHPLLMTHPEGEYLKGLLLVRV